MRSRVFVLAVLAAALLVAPEAALASDTVIASVSEPTSIDAYAGRVVWSERSPEGYRLVEYHKRAVRQLPIPPAPTPFDVDLGPNDKGRTVAVYSRCAQTPTVPSSDGHRSCDLYVYDFARQRETTLKRANSTADESFPTIWNERIAFVRTYKPKGKDPVGVRRAYWRRLSGPGRTRRIRTPRFAPFPQHLDMRGRRVAIFWAGEVGGGEVRLATTGGDTRVLSIVPGSGAAAQTYGVVGVSITAGFVYWVVTEPDDPPELGELRRYDIARRREERATLQLSPHTVGFVQKGTVSYHVIPRSEAACKGFRICPGPYDIHRIDGLVFERAAELPLQ